MPHPPPPSQVLDDVSWSILPNSRWHLQGSNGSGKTTLISILLGHHPRSFSIPKENLSLFGQPRRLLATPTLRAKIGHVSPEVFAAFPRNMGLSVGEAIATGYEGVFARRAITSNQKERIITLLEPFQDMLETASSRSSTPKTIDEIYGTSFSHFPPNLQSLFLFLRAIVSRPRLLVLDEASQGMDEATWARCRRLLEKEWKVIKESGQDQAVVCVSHWVEEVPWEAEEGQVIRLEAGKKVV